MLHVNDLTYRIADRLLFDAATVHIPPGHRVGIVGRNGVGKTTLLRLIQGQVSAESGSLRVRPRARVGSVAQEAPGGPASLLDTVLAADHERSALLDEAETAQDPHRIAEIHTRLADIAAHAAPAKAASILSGLGFDEAAQARPVAEYSGGWRMRVALAAALFAEPDLLLLDEPTNHLDLESALWLESYLRRYPGTLLLVSHDNALLNRVVGHILHVQGGKLNLYTGGYDRFDRVRRERENQAEKLRSKQLAQRRHMQAFVDRFRYKASKARQAQSRIKALEKMRDLAPVLSEWTVTFRFPEPEPLSPPLIALEKAAVGYEPDRPVLSRLDLRIDMDDRIALLGANGNGKSTLAKLLAGRLTPMEGRARASRKLQVGYFAQHQIEELHPDQTVFAHMAALMPDQPPEKPRARLGRFGFAQAHADALVRTLSGGEKARLMLALMSHAAPHLMILDEPTNHLDVEAREALVAALNEYSGAVLIISHDRHLIELTADRLWLVADGTVVPFDGDLEDYVGRVLGSRRQDGGKSASPSSSVKVNQRRARAEARAATAPLRQAASRAAREVDRLTKEKAKLEVTLADPATYEQPSDRLSELMKQQSDLQQQLEQAEAEWLEAEEALDAANADHG